MTESSLPVQGTTQKRGTSVLGRRAGRWRRLAPYLFSAPALILHVSVILIPSLVTFGLSLFQWDGLSTPKFIGLGNFHTMFTEDRIFRIAFTNTVKWTLLFLVVPVAMGLFSALMIAAIRVGQMAYRTMYYLPATMASIVVGRLWLWIYNPFTGLNVLFQQAGLGLLALNWLSSPNIALYAVAFADNWRWWGFLSVTFLAALSQIDPVLHEAAALDGAGTLQRFWYITLPLLRPTLIFVWLTTILASFQVFDMLFVMTKGGPGNSSQSLATWIYFQFINSFNAGYASSIAAMTTLMLSAVIVGYIYLRMRGWEV
jgi:raffinose/stachyose/melibiose transport system permease protein